MLERSVDVFEKQMLLERKNNDVSRVDRRSTTYI